MFKYTYKSYTFVTFIVMPTSFCFKLLCTILCIIAFDFNLFKHFRVFILILNRILFCTIILSIVFHVSVLLSLLFP
uniref:G-protein coupled receptors family 1 profile domain-containing protein n=1 Tax=Anguilla anguilla TaxID=7936 RepID=A0A0E9RG03_ANGAN